MSAFIAEVIGTMMLILLGDGVVGNVVLKQTKGHNAGLIVITFGWAIAVFVGVFIAADFSGAHINPAVTIGLALAGKFAWNLVPMYLAAQFLGGAIGAFLVWLHYKDHFAATEETGDKLGVFCTALAIRNANNNLNSEISGTFVLVFAVLYITGDKGYLGSLHALPVALVVLGIGLSLGGTTGYAINPARDLSPRIMHAILPIPGKKGSDWSYSWIPVIGPLGGGLAAAGVYLAISG